MKKKVAAIFMASIMACSMAACGSSGGSSDSSKTDSKDKSTASGTAENGSGEVENHHRLPDLDGCSGRYGESTGSHQRHHKR